MTIIEQIKTKQRFGVNLKKNLGLDGLNRSQNSLREITGKVLTMPGGKYVHKIKISLEAELSFLQLHLHKKDNGCTFTTLTKNFEFNLNWSLKKTKLLQRYVL